MSIFTIQGSKEEDVELIKSLKLLHSELRNLKILESGKGYTKDGIWNSVKTIRELLKTSKYSFLLKDIDVESLRQKIKEETI